MVRVSPLAEMCLCEHEGIGFTRAFEGHTLEGVIRCLLASLFGSSIVLGTFSFEKCRTMLVTSIKNTGVFLGRLDHEGHNPSGPVEPTDLTLLTLFDAFKFHFVLVPVVHESIAHQTAESHDRSCSTRGTIATKNRDCRAAVFEREQISQGQKHIFWPFLSR